MARRDKYLEMFKYFARTSNTKKVCDMSYQCPGCVLGQSAMSWLCLAVKVCGFAVSANPDVPTSTQDTARTLLGQAICRGLIT